MDSWIYGDKMKRIVCIILILLMCSCKVEKKDDEYTYLLFATPLKEHDIWLKAKEGFDDACAYYQIECDWIGPDVIDTNEMNSVVKTGILQNADGIITQGVISPELVKQAYEKDIMMVLVDSDIQDSERLVYFGKDFHEQAVLLLEEVEKNYGYDQYLKIVIQVAERSFQIAEDQIQEIKDVFSMHEGGYEIAYVCESKSDSIQAKKEWEKVLHEHPDVNVAINFAAEGAQACSEAAIENGIRSSLLIYGVDDMESTLQLVRNGGIDGTVVTSFYDYGYRSVQVLMDYVLEDKLPSQNTQSPALLIVNKENVDTYEKE